MRVFVNATAATRGGAVTHLQNVLPELANQHPDWDMLVVLSDGGRKQEPLCMPKLPSVRYVKMEWSHASKRSVWENTSIRRELKKYDVLFSPLNHGTILSPIPQVLFVRNALYFERNESLMKSIMNGIRLCITDLSIRSSRTVILPSQSMHDALRGKIQTRRNVQVIHHGLDPAENVSDAEYRRYRSPALDRWREYPNKVLYVGSPASHKNVSRLVDAVHAIPNGEAQYGLALTIDEGEFSDQFGDRGSPNILPIGRVPHNYVPRLMAESDLTVCPSLVESFNQVYLQAQAFAPRVLASDIPVHRELNRRDCAFFDPFDVQLLRDSIVRACSGRSAARLDDDLLSEFSWEAHAAELGEILREAALCGV